MADLMTVSGITRLVTVDLHAAQIQGFFDIPVDHMPGGPILADYVKKKASLRKTWWSFLRIWAV